MATFRHSFATILKSARRGHKTVQELMRHPNSSVTLNLYAQAVTDIKCSAQSKGRAARISVWGRPVE